MLQRTLVIGGTAMLLLVASVAFGQQEKQGRQNRGPQQGQGRGPGGFGGGFTGGGSAGLLATPDVQKELAVSAEQKKLIDDMQSDLREQMRGSFSGFRDLQNLSQEERQKRMDEARAKGEEINKKTDEMIGMILDAKQAERLGELRLQREGLSALSRADVAKKLGLTEEQQAKIKEIRDAARQRTGDGARNFREMSEEERRQLFAQADERRKKQEADTLAVLTSEQTQTLEKLKGKEFKFAERTGRGPGGQPGQPKSGGGDRRRPERKKESS